MQEIEKLFEVFPLSGGPVLNAYDFLAHHLSLGACQGMTPEACKEAIQYLHAHRDAVLAAAREAK